MVDIDYKKINNLGNKKALFLIAGIILGLTVGFLAAQNSQISQQKASQKLVSTLEAQSGQQLEVVSTKSENGLYRIDVSDSQDQLSTYYTTKDGRLVSSNMNDLDQLRQTIAAQQQFIGCLSDKGAVLYGNSSQQSTAVQIRALGGSNIASPVYKDVNSKGILEEAVQRGVQRVPSWYYNGSTLSGVNEMSKISQFTGCQLGSAR